MTKNDWMIATIVGVVLGILGGLAFLPKVTHPQTANASTGVEDVLALTLNSYTKWSTAKGEAQFTFYGPKGEKQIYVDSFEIAQPNKAYIESVSQDGKGQNTIWISDGVNSYSLDESSKTYESAKLPKFSQDFSLLPKTLSEVDPDMVYHHPFAMVIPLPVRDYLFPQWFSQGGGIASLVGEENILDRKTWIVEQQKGSDLMTAWVDEKTGVILKYSQQIDGQLFLDVVFSNIEFDATIDSAIFSPAAAYKPVDTN